MSPPDPALSPGIGHARPCPSRSGNGPVISSKQALAMCRRDPVAAAKLIIDLSEKADATGPDRPAVA